MAKKGGGDKGTSGKETKVVRQNGLLFELEYTAVKGRKLVYEVLKEVLADRDAELTPGLFAKFCLHLPPKQYVPTILASLEKTRFSPEKVLSELEAELNKAFRTKNLTLDPGLMRIVKNAADHNLVAGALSGLDPATAEALLEAKELKAWGVKLVCTSSSSHLFPATDGWIKLAHALGLQGRECLAVTSSAGACHAALVGDIWTMAVPDEYTAFQDFSGADAVVEKIDEKILRDMLTLMKARA